MTISYRLAAAAEADLRGIIRYTRRQWGDAQVRVYMSRLAQCLERTAAGDRASRQLPDVHPELWTARCDPHQVFLLKAAAGPALIIAILHPRMDLMARLASRLSAIEREAEILPSD